MAAEEVEGEVGREGRRDDNYTLNLTLLESDAIEQFNTQDVILSVKKC